MSFTREEYDRFVSRSPQRSIYCHSWWLDAVAPGSWDVALVRSHDEIKGEIQAALPYRIEKKWGLTRLAHPDLSPVLGVLFKPLAGKPAAQLSQQRDLMTELIEKLPPADGVEFTFHPSVTNWLPFYWKGFSQTTGYTYLIDRQTSGDVEAQLWDELRSNVRNDVRKAQKTLSIRDDLSFDEFLRIYRKTFERQGADIPVAEGVIRRVDEACSARNCREILFACDEGGRVHGVVYLVWDDRCVNYLFGGADPELRGSAAQSLLVWEAVLRASRKGMRFDFEGSMVQPIELFFRGFGGVQTPLMTVFRKNLRYSAFERLRKLKRV